MSVETPDEGVNDTPPTPTPTPSVRLGPRLVGARLALFWEQLWPALLPALMLAGIFLALALFDILPLLPGWLHGLVLVLIAGGLVWLIWRGVRRVTIAGIEAARRRIEQASDLAHRPLQTLSDKIGAGGDDEESVALWRLHQQRLAEMARRLRVGIPTPGAGRADPWALRILLLVILFIGAAVGGSTADQRLLRAFNPEFSAFAAAGPGNLEIWITPPAYTGLAPMFPGRAQEPADGDGPAPLTIVKAPVGSNLTARVSGGRGKTELVLGDRRVAFETVDDENVKIEAGLEQSGRLAVVQDGVKLAEWTLELVADQPPTVEFSAPPARGARGALRIAFRAKDDYGLQNAAAELHRTYERGAVIGKEKFELPLNLPGPNARTADEFDFHDLTPHPWAGLPVRIRLRVADGAGHVVHGDPVQIVLPERMFRHPVARAVIEQRKRLTTEPERRRSIIQRLAVIASQPGMFDHRTVTYLALSAAASRLVHEPGDTAIPQVRDLLWDTALGIEDGRLSVAERDLRRAQQELMRALSQNAPNSELERLMRQLEMALNRFLNEIARQAANPNAQDFSPMDPNAQLLRTTDIQRMLKQIRDLLRSGNTKAAREMLAQLRNLLENLRAGRLSGNNAQSQAGRRMMRKFHELIRRQRDLLNRSFRQSNKRDGALKPGAMQGDAKDQRSLREMLKQLRQQLRRMGMKPGGKDGKGPGKAFGEADQFMGEAAGALDRDAPGQATGPQGQALDALQRAGRGMMQQMRSRSARGSGLGMQPRFNPLRQRRDPLGRYMPTPGGIDSDHLKIPDQSTVERAQRILDELRKRAGQGFRPRIELDYIDRLLRRF
jgi:uncharacterized protein (TIGR02302 family)